MIKYYSYGYFYRIEIIHLDLDCCYLSIYTPVLIYDSPFYLLKASIFSKSANTYFGQLPHTAKNEIG